MPVQERQEGMMEKIAMIIPSLMWWQLLWLQDMPDEIETASCVLPQTGFSIYYEDKLLSDINYIYGDTCFFQTFGIPVLKGPPKI